MENYIESALLSLINQSFKDFEIIIVNDNSIDNTENIIKQIQFKDKRIKYINHLNNLGVYASRVDGILNAEGKYVILMDPDDLLMNQDLFQELYNYNLENTFDIIEFLVYHKKEGRKNIFFPKDHKLNHYHNYQNHIINQPELSDIIFYNPNSKEYSSIICRSIWNKLIKKEIILIMIILEINI
jgi:glycosyltransferase involved in cell wall biosynthesis